MWKRSLSLTIILSFFLTLELSSEILRVTNLNSSGSNSLRDRIENDAAAGDTVWVDVAGTITLSSPITISKPLTILGPMPTHLKIDGNDSTRQFVVDHPDSKSKLVGVHLLNGNSGTSTGGSVLIKDGTFRMTNCLVEGSVAEDHGGAIANTDTLVVKRSSFLNCSTQVSGDGGAIYSSNGWFFVLNSTFSMNHAAGQGGAIQNLSSLGRIANNTIVHNSASGEGGAISVSSPSLMLLTANIVEYNTSTTAGPNLYTPPTDTIEANGGGYNLISDTTGANFQYGSYDLLQGPETSGLSDPNDIDTNGHGFRYYRLPDSSNVIDKGQFSNTIRWDQRYAPRDLDGDTNGNIRTDIGAVEYTPYVVDDPDGTLGTLTLSEALDAILSLQSPEPPYYISFDLPSGQTTITNTLAYQVDSRTIIDGWSQDGSQVPGPNDPTVSGEQVSPGTPLVEIDGSSSLVNGFEVNASRSVIRGLSVHSQDPYGVVISADSVRITGNHIGLGSDTSGSGNGSAGVIVQNSAFETRIGGYRHFQRNVFANKNPRHIYITEQAADINRILGNFIGTAPDGAGTLAQGQTGIHVENNSSIIGSDSLIGRNLISGNLSEGVLLSGVNFPAYGNEIRHNHIGTDHSATAPIPNGNGVVSNVAEYNILRSNIISGNSNDGIKLEAASNGTRVLGNHIGLDSSGQASLGNQGDGIDMQASSQNHLIGGGYKSDSSNVISGNAGSGVRLRGSDVTVKGNFIGTGEYGMSEVPNGGAGIYGSKVDSAYIGGVIGEESNLIAGNSGSGILKDSAGVLLIGGNYIGLDTVPDTLGNGAHGIHLDHPQGPVNIGSRTMGYAYGNWIGGNASHGVLIENASVYQDGHLVAGNNIGTDASSSLLLGNLGAGVVVNGDSNRIGYISSGSVNSNRIMNNRMEGIRMDSSRTGNRFYRNVIKRNGALGIDLGADGVTVNDSGDTDSGPNGLSNYPNLFGVSNCAGNTQAKFELSGEAGKQHRVEFYRVNSTDVDPSGHGEMTVFLWADTVTMSSFPPDTFTSTAPISPSFSSSDSLTAIATNLDRKTSSEFAANIAAADSFTMSPDSLSGVVCAGDSNGQAFVSIQGGIPPFQLNWYDSTYSQTLGSKTSFDLSDTLTGLPPGKLHATVTDDLGCSDTITFLIDEADTLDAEAGPNDTVCLGDSVLLGGSPTSTLSGVVYDWSPGSDLLDSTVANPTAYPSNSRDYVVTVTDPATGCTAMDTVTIDTLPSLSAFAGADTSICFGDTVRLGGSPSATGGSGSYQYQWSPNTALSSPTVADPQASPGSITEYYITVTDSNVSCTAVDSVGISVMANPNLSMGGTDSLCNGDTGTVFASSGASIVDDWQWNTGDTIDTIQVAPSYDSTFVVTGVDTSQGCSSTDSFSVQVFPTPTTNISGMDSICGGDSLTLQANGAASYIWQDGSTDSSYLASPDSSKLYWVEGTNAICSERDSFYVTVLSSPSAPTSSMTHQTLCPGDPFVPFGVAPDSNYLTEWYKDPAPSSLVASGDTLSSISLSGDSTYRYAVYRDTSVGCAGPSLEFLVRSTDSTSLMLPSDTSVCVGDSVTLQASGASSYSWSPSDGLSDTSGAAPQASPSNTITYRLLARFANGCRIRDSVVVEVSSSGNCGLQVYNAFSPNGDGINEKWVIEGIRAYPENKVTIYNRWGDRLERIEGYDNEEKVWDGTRSNGNALPAGTYYYVIDLYGDRNQQLKGYVQITK